MLHRITPAHTARAAAFNFSRVTDRLKDLRTDTAIIGINSMHLMHSMQPKNIHLFLKLDQSFTLHGKAA